MLLSAQSSLFMPAVEKTGWGFEDGWKVTMLSPAI